MAAFEAPGILYLEGYTDLNLLREWARVLRHPLKDYFDRTPFWRAKQPPGRSDAAEVPVKDHFEALRLVNEQMTGVWLVDGDGRGAVPPSQAAETGKLNRMLWTRYESESYLVHPGALTRFIEQKTGAPPGDVVHAFFDKLFGAELAKQFEANPFNAPPLVDNYLKNTKARTEILGALLETAGIHGFDYTSFDEIAAVMRPEEIHPEVKEKLDFIQQAFGL